MYRVVALSPSTLLYVLAELQHFSQIMFFNKYYLLIDKMIHCQGQTYGLGKFYMTRNLTYW